MREAEKKFRAPPERSETSAMGILLGAVLLILAVNGLVIVRLVDQRQNDLDAARYQGTALAQSLAVAVEQYFETYIALTQTLEEQLAVASLDAERTEILLRGQKYRLPAVHEIVVVDAQGQIAFWTAYGPKPPVADRPYFLNHARTSRPDILAIGEPLRSRLHEERWFISVSRRRVGPDGGFGGSIAILVDLQATAEYFASLHTADAFRVRLIHDSGQVIGTIPPDAGMIGRQDEPPKPDERSRIISASADLPGLPIRIATGLDITDATARWTRLAQATGALLLAVDVILALLLLQLWRRNAERVADRSALQAANDEAQRANHEKSRFLATMSHEIRTPMSAVVGMLEFLRHSPLNDDQKRIVGVIERSSAALLQILNDILDFSKIEAGHLDINPVPTDVSALVNEVADAYAGSASAKGLTVERFVDPALGKAHVVDAFRLRQVFSNFISNAIKFTDAGSVTLSAVRIAAKDGMETIRFSVTDTGIGIPSDVLPALFRPFTQAEASTTSRFGGTGLGLSICSRLADLLGGRIEAESAVGRGTTMSLILTLPLSDEMPEGERTRQQSAGEIRRRQTPSIADAMAEGTLVLIADDHPVNRMMLARQLGMIGYAAVAAEDGIQALEIWRRGGCAMLITDINMPRMNGLELARRIRAAAPAHERSIPIVALTANAAAADLENAGEAAINDYLVKPVTVAKLAEVMARWLPLRTGRGDPDEANDAAPLEAGALEPISGGDPAAEADILAEFQESGREDRKRLEAAVRAGDYAAIADGAHRILGASRTIGAMRAAALAADLEAAAAKRDEREIGRIWTALAEESDRLDTFITRRMATTGADR